MRSRIVNTIGFIATGAVLLVVMVTKFLAGAWIAIVAMGLLFVLMKLIRRHYDGVSRELAEQAAEHGDEIVLPSRNHALVLVSKLHLPTLRALAYARATRPDVLEALTVSVDDGETRELVHQWEESDISVPLKVIASPVPRNHPPGTRLRQTGQQGIAAHRGDGVHPGVRGGPLVGTVAAQPECAAAQGPVAVHARASW